MKKEEIKDNKELKRIIALKLGKMPYDEIEAEDFDRIDEIALNARLINGKESGISLDAISLFPNLRRLKLSNYRITKEAISLIASLVGLRDLEIYGAEFEEGINFEGFEHTLKSLRFYNCLEIGFAYPRLEEVWLNQTDINFSKIDLQTSRRIVIRNGNVCNICDLTDFPNLESVNLDGSILTKDDEIVKDIQVNSKTEYTHKDEVELINGERV